MDITGLLGLSVVIIIFFVGMSLLYKDQNIEKDTGVDNWMNPETYQQVMESYDKALVEATTENTSRHRDSRDNYEIAMDNFADELSAANRGDIDFFILKDKPKETNRLLQPIEEVKPRDNKGKFIKKK